MYHLQPTKIRKKEFYSSYSFLEKIYFLIKYVLVFVGLLLVVVCICTFLSMNVYNVVTPLASPLALYHPFV